VFLIASSIGALRTTRCGEVGTYVGASITLWFHAVADGAGVFLTRTSGARSYTNGTCLRAFASGDEYVAVGTSASPP
jgi:hypothetical protein